MNTGHDQLSLGNLFKIIKSLSVNKAYALQSELFSILFDVENMNDTTVNNYCVGLRGIGTEYKKNFVLKEKKYKEDNEVFCEDVISIISIIDGKLHEIKRDKINFINTSESAKKLAEKLYELAKEDRQVKEDLVYKFNELIKNGRIYECLVEELLFAILYKKQPQYEEDIKKAALKEVINDSNVSSSSLMDYVNLKFNNAVNYDYMLRKLADEGNIYACYDVGFNEYNGYYKNYPRYAVAFKYLDKAARMNHGEACYLIGKMYIKGYLGNKSPIDLEKGYEYLNRAIALNSIPAFNLLGNMYYEGIYPANKSLSKAKDYYLKAASSDYVFALNNLGKISEKDGDIDTAVEYYKRSASYKESWACNKLGEYYRTVKNEPKEAYKYYLDALDSSYLNINYYAYYNLAKYYYFNGSLDIEKDEDKALKYFDFASLNGIIEASIELLEYYVKKYLFTREDKYLDKIKYYKNMIETNKKYNDKIKEDVEGKINSITSDINIKLDDVSLL